MHKSHVTIDPTSGYEKRDVVLPTLIKWVIILFVFVSVSALISWWVYMLFLPRGRDRMALEPLTPGQHRPPSPVIQAYPRVEMRQFRAEENATVVSYGWANKEKGEVRIPIDRAVEMLAERGLPTGQAPVSKEDKEMRPGNRPPGAEPPTEAGHSTEPNHAPPPQVNAPAGESEH